MRFPDNIERLAFEIVEKYAAEGKKIVTAESCTGGLIAAALTSVSGSSKVLERGFVTYSDDAKVELLGVLPDDLGRFSAISPEVAEEMAYGALTYSLADVALSVTGVAGPTGGTDQKPVGLVYYGIATKAGTRFHATMHFKGPRHEVREQATQEGLTLLLSLMEKE